jgi:hypothetical protein
MEDNLQDACKLILEQNKGQHLNAENDQRRSQGRNEGNKTDSLRSLSGSNSTRRCGRRAYGRRRRSSCRGRHDEVVPGSYRDDRGMRGCIVDWDCFALGGDIRKRSTKESC